jgi:hypothetical protein
MLEFKHNCHINRKQKKPTNRLGEQHNTQQRTALAAGAQPMM